jgi:hypothetical protein
MQLSEKILMIEPRGFAFNRETSKDNFFQSPGSIKAPVESALKEFHEMKKKLMKAGIMVTVVSPDDSQPTPDSVFPNNWFSTTPDGELILYPMMAANRRKERRNEIIDKLKKTYSKVIDLSPLEQREMYLEGTGSLVIDHENKRLYASLSKRTNEEALKEWNKNKGYELIVFTSYDQNNETIYHTNVMLSLGDGFAIACLESIRDNDQREMLKKKLEEHNELFTITLAQMQSFCGNCLALRNNAGEKFLIMSSQAYNAFSEHQKSRLIRLVTIIYSPLTTIETLGGGSARCMMAELF